MIRIGETTAHLQLPTECGRFMVSNVENLNLRAAKRSLVPYILFIKFFKVKVILGKNTGAATATPVFNIIIN